MTQLIAVIGDELTVNGILLAGAGMKDAEGKSNFAVVDAETPRPEILAHFKALTARTDVQVLFINQFAASKIREEIIKMKGERPVIMEIPASNEKYDQENDPVLKNLQ
ncbi:V-type_proton ATPase subunit F [Hexamita inflata]|uniref:V-type proton ATPase subunit F n=1 Tax=Hexamita inflata TaxID=28002 RepID=A0AA86TQY6_9EUKA|nr:V-type proton ATPase subunit F [Hexamita inflata]CAI9925090.1 V-type proton ATPase subunit F [Hexamita inflata]CAI9956659.1 V-type proton ATPase subunit F [Hexamita inflata]